MSIRSHSKGFTLVETLVVVAILGVLATLAGTAVFHGTARVRVSNAAFEVSALYTAAQMRASSTGMPHYVVFHDDGSQFGAYLLERADSLGPYNWAREDVMNLAAVGGTRHDYLRLSHEGGLGFEKLGASGVTALPAPFSSVPLTPAGTDRLLGGCSFCTEGTGGARGVLRFSPDGTVQVMTGGAETGGAIAFAPDSRGGQSGSLRVVVIAAPAGAIRVF